MSKSSLTIDVMEISNGFVYKKSLKRVLSGGLALMSCLLAVAAFNTLNAGTIVDCGSPTPFWIV